MVQNAIKSQTKKARKCCILEFSRPARIWKQSENFAPWKRCEFWAIYCDK